MGMPETPLERLCFSRPVGSRSGLQLVFRQFSRTVERASIHSMVPDHDVELPANPFRNRLSGRFLAELILDICSIPFYAGAYVWGRVAR